MKRYTKLSNGRYPLIPVSEYHRFTDNWCRLTQGAVELVPRAPALVRAARAAARAVSRGAARTAGRAAGAGGGLSVPLLVVGVAPGAVLQHLPGLVPQAGRR